MKNYLLIFTILFLSGICVNAQTREELKKAEQERQKKEKEIQKHQEKIKKSLEKKQAILSLDTLFFEGKPVCLVTTDGSGVFGGRDYTFKSFDGTELIYCKYDANVISNKSEPYYTYTFFETGLKAEDGFSIGYDKPFEKVAKRGLIKNGKTDTASIKRFVMVVGNKFTDKQNNNANAIGSLLTIVNNRSINNNESSGNNYKLVSRNKQGIVMVMVKDILQSNVTIGYYTKTAEIQHNTNVWATRIYLPDGTLVCESATPDLQPGSIEFKTQKDNRLHTISTSFGNDTRDMVNYLIQHSYL